MDGDVVCKQGTRTSAVHQTHGEICPRLITRIALVITKARSTFVLARSRHRVRPFGPRIGKGTRMRWSVRTTILSTGERLPLLVEGGPFGNQTLRRRATPSRTASAKRRDYDAAQACGDRSRQGFCEAQRDRPGRACRCRYLSLTRGARRFFRHLPTRCADGPAWFRPRMLQTGSAHSWTSCSGKPNRSSPEQRVSTAPDCSTNSEGLRTSLSSFASCAGACRGGHLHAGKFGLEPEQRTLLLHAITPGSAANPWGLAMQHRNHAIVLTPIG
jgi:hypothetical protein